MEIGITDVAQWRRAIAQDMAEQAREIVRLRNENERLRSLLMDASPGKLAP